MPTAESICLNTDEWAETENLVENEVLDKNNDNADDTGAHLVARSLP